MLIILGVEILLGDMFWIVLGRGVVVWGLNGFDGGGVIGGCGLVDGVLDSIGFLGVGFGMLGGLVSRS